MPDIVKEIIATILSFILLCFALAMNASNALALPFIAIAILMMLYGMWSVFQSLNKGRL